MGIFLFLIITNYKIFLIH